MVEEAGDGRVKISKKLPSTVLSRQAAPKVYDLNASFYFFRREFFDAGHDGVIQDGLSRVYVMPHPCFDLDEPIDFEMLEFLVRNKKLDFEI